MDPNALNSMLIDLTTSHLTPLTYPETVYEPMPLSEPSDAVAADMAAYAFTRQLTIYAGAGLSAADPTLLPGASGLAQRLFTVLHSRVALGAVNQTDLVNVAEAVSALPKGRELLRKTILEVADLLHAEYNFAHEVVALLLCEGAVTVIETNYDDCVERAAHPERLAVVWTRQGMLDAPGTALLKAHGCATEPRSMIITSDELDNVPSWAETRIAAELRRSRVAFVGIGSPADYIIESFHELANEVGLDHLVFVDPSLAGWDSPHPPDWRAILPELGPEQRDIRTAEEFLDALLRAYLDHPRRNARDAVSRMAVDHPQRIGLEVVLTAMESRDAVSVLRWIRTSSLIQLGVAVAASALLIQGLLSLGVIVSDLSIARLSPAGWMIVTKRIVTDDPSLEEEPSASPQRPSQGETPVMILMVHDFLLGSAAAAVARRRVLQARTNGIVETGDEVVVVVIGHAGPMSGELEAHQGDDLEALLSQHRSASGGTPNNLISSDRPGHLIDGVESGSVLLVSGGQLIEAT